MATRGLCRETVTRNHSGEKKHICRQCIKSFNRKDSLKTHQLSVHSGKRQKCTQCDYQTDLAGNLRTHITTHSGENLNYEWCNKSFKLKLISVDSSQKSKERKIKKNRKKKCKVYSSKVYFCKMYPTCVSSKLCELIFQQLNCICVASTLGLFYICLLMLSLYNNHVERFYLLKFLWQIFSCCCQCCSVIIYGLWPTWSTKAPHAESLFQHISFSFPLLPSFPKGWGINIKITKIKKWIKYAMIVKLHTVHQITHIRQITVFQFMHSLLSNKQCVSLHTEFYLNMVCDFT